MSLRLEALIFTLKRSQIPKSYFIYIYIFCTRETQEFKNFAASKDVSTVRLCSETRRDIFQQS